MSELHPLTKKCLAWHANPSPALPLNVIICTWLSNRADRIEAACKSTGYANGRHILSLDTSEPEQPWYGNEDIKERSMKCIHVYESDCHGIEMIKDPNGKEWAIGGTDRKERWTHDPWCGKELPRPKEKTLAEKLFDCWRNGRPEIYNPSVWESMADIAEAHFGRMGK